MTFSLVAHDSVAGEWGVAVASKFLAAGAVVPWAAAGAGAVATQAHANPSYGPDGLALLADATSAQAVVSTLTAADDGKEHRQLGVVDHTGGAATFTGAECHPWAGGRVGRGFACQGNILNGPEVVDAMVAAFEAGEGDLAARLHDALLAGDDAGGDRRGRQSAALLVVRAGGGYLGESDVAVDLRVDDHTHPVQELGRLLDVHRLLFPRAEDLSFIPIDDALASELRRHLRTVGFDPGSDQGSSDEELESALFSFAGVENLEARWSAGPRVERVVLEALRARAAAAHPE